MSIHLGSGIKKGRKWDIGKIVKEGFFMDSSLYVWKLLYGNYVYKYNYENREGK